MRISKKAKEKNREKILKEAKRLFSKTGFEKTTTRDIAAAMGMAVGTMFNYFDSKEALAMTLAAEALSKGRETYWRRRMGNEAFVEELFLLITSELRLLRPYRKFIGPVLESTMSFFSKSSISTVGEQARNEHLEIVETIIVRHGCSFVPPQISASIYWSLYLGILAFWSTDDSRNQEETLALIDYSLHLFSQTIRGAEKGECHDDKK